MTALVLLLALPLAAQSLIERANAAREAQRLEEAIALYQQVVKAEPANAEAWWYLGLGHYEKDQYAAAAPAFRKLTALYPRQGAGFAMLGLCEFRNQRYDAALAALRRAHVLGVPEQNGLHNVAHYHLALLLNRNAEFELASTILRKLATADAVTSQVVEAAGMTALRLRQLPAGAPFELKEAIDWAGNASVLAWQQRYPEAMAGAKRLAAKYPSQPNVHYLMGYLRLLTNEGDALEEFRKELALDANHLQATLQIAYEYLRRGEPEQGAPYAARAVKLAPSDFIAHNIQGRILLALDKPAEAAVALQTAVTLAPNSPEAHFHLASALTRLGRKQEAARHREIFAKLDKERQR